MKLEEIQNLYAEDVEIEPTDLSSESLKIPKLQLKYHRIYSQENMILKKLETEMKILKRDKFEFFVDGPSLESKAKGWKFPAKGRIIKSDASMYIDADQDVIQLNLKIALQREKVDFLDAILKQLNNRGYNIKTALDFIKYTNGG